MNNSGIIILVISDGVHFFQIFNPTFYYVSACLENYAIVGIFDKFFNANVYFNNGAFVFD